MALVQGYTAAQSADSKKILVTDTTNYSANGFTPSQFVRTFVVTDADDVVINTYVMANNDLTLSYPISINQWQVITFTLLGGPVSSTPVVHKFPFEQLYRNAYRALISMSCGGCIAIKGICDVDGYYQGAEFAIPPGDGVSYNTNINAAYALIAT